MSPSSESQIVVRKRISQVEGQICTLEAVVLLLEVRLSASSSSSLLPLSCEWRRATNAWVRAQDFGHPEVGPVLLTNLRIMARNVLSASSKLTSSKGERLAVLDLLDPR